jgi:hypothetical protein
MSRRPRLPPPPIKPIEPEDLEGRPRPPLVSPSNVMRAALLVVGGAAWGAGVRFANSLPVDMGFLAFVLEVGVGAGFVVALLLLLLFRGFEVDRVVLVAALALGGAWIGLSFGPTVAPPVTVTGTFTFAPTYPAVAVTRGEVACEWAAGRWRIGGLRTGPLAGFATPHRLAIDFLRRTISLADGVGSNLIALGHGAFVQPPDGPQRREGDAGGTLDILVLQVDLASTPVDPLEVRARFSWDCPGPPVE